MESLKGIDNVNQSLFEDTLRDLFNGKCYREPLIKERTNYFKFFIKNTDEALMEETNKRFQRDRYCAEGHRVLKTTHLSVGYQGSCRICQARTGLPYGWACEVPTCEPLCHLCYAELFGEEAVKNTPIWRIYDHQENMSEFQNHNYPHCDSSTHELKLYLQGEKERQCRGCSKYIKSGVEIWLCLAGGYKCGEALCVPCCVAKFGQEAETEQRVRSAQGLIGQSKAAIKGANQKIVQPLCDQQHKLAILKGKVYPGGDKQHNCQKCQAQNINESGCFWNCLKCDYDLCKTCSIEAWGDTIFLKAKSLLGLWDDVNKFVCDDQGHTLIVIQGCLESLEGTLDCTACGKYCLEKEQYYWGCPDCKYHICKDCFKQSQKTSPEDPKGKIARKVQKKRHFRNAILERLSKMYNDEENAKFWNNVNKVSSQDHTPKYENYLKAGLNSCKDSGLKKCAVEWTQALAAVLVEQCQEYDGKFSEALLAAAIFNQFVIASTSARRSYLDTPYLSKVATIFEDGLKLAIARSCDFNLKPPKEPCYFASQVFDSGNQYEMLSKLVAEGKQKNIVKVAAKKTIPMTPKFVSDMKQTLGQFSMKGKPIYAQCKYGKTVSDIDLPYNHGISRSEMKYIEELAAKPENQLKIFKGIRDEIVEIHIKRAELFIKEYGEEMYNIVSQVVIGEKPYGEKEIPVVTRSFCQQDMLRCKAYFDSVEKIQEAVAFIKRKYPLVRIKNRMSFLGDVMINFWYEDVVAEAQLVYHEETETENDKDAKIRNKVNHFLYEIERNPLGPLVHCAELLFKNAKERQIDFKVLEYEAGQGAFRQPIEIKKDAKVHLLEDGTEYHGDLVDGKRHGQGKEYLPDGKLYEGQFQNDKYSGSGKLTMSDGSVYEGNFSEGLRNGQGKMKYVSGLSYDGSWKDNLKDGRGIMKYPQHAKWESYDGGWQKDLKHGNGARVTVKGYYPLPCDFANDKCSDRNDLGPEF